MGDIGVLLSALLKKRLKSSWYRDPNCSVANKLSVWLWAVIIMLMQKTVTVMIT